MKKPEPKPKPVDCDGGDGDGGGGLLSVCWSKTKQAIAFVYSCVAGAHTPMMTSMSKNQRTSTTVCVTIWTSVPVARKPLRK
jgi:hypothetical protein